MLKNGTPYVDIGQDYYENRYHDRIMQNLQRKAKELGYELVEMSGGTTQNGKFVESGS